MKFDDRTGVLALLLAGAVGLVTALAIASRDPHDRIMRLERVAEQLERARHVDSATVQHVRSLVAEARRDSAAGETLLRRQASAIARIEFVLALRDSTGATNRAVPVSPSQ